jgi:predicted Zn-dependent protease
MGKNLDGALQLALRALAKMPEQPEFMDTVGWIHHLRQSNPQAVYYLKQSADKDQKNPVYQYHLGMAYAQMGEDASARRYLKQALSLNRDFPGAEQAKKAMASLIY